MATIHAGTMKEITYSGTAPTATVVGAHLLDNAQAGDKILLNKVFAGALVTDVKLVCAAMSGVKLDIGFEYVDGLPGSRDDAFFSDVDAAGRKDSDAPPVRLEHDAIIVATVKSGTASGQITTVTTFEPRGV